MALVYIYRPDEERGRVVRYHVTNKQGPIVWLIRGGYYPYLAPAGRDRVLGRHQRARVGHRAARRRQDLLLEGTVEQGAWFGRPELVFESAEIARPEVERCVLLPPADVKRSP